MIRAARRVRSHFSHHPQEWKDAATYYFGEAWQFYPSP